MKIQFTVSPDNIVGFAEILEDNEVKNEIIGTDENDDLVIDVYYTRENRNCLVELEAFGEIE